jgi:hypothetical protein
MGKYSCEKCAKTFSQKSHYDKHLTRKNPCEIQTDKIKALIDKAVEEKLIELNKKLFSNNTENNITINITEQMDISKMSKLELLEKCKELGITKCSSKNKSQLIELINGKNKVVEEPKIILSNEEIAPQNTQIIEVDTKTLNVIDLFCGCGGMSKGLTDAGLNVIAGIDIWDKAVESYNKNYHHKAYCADLTQLPPEKFNELYNKENKNVDILVGGPPCQSFSIAGKRDKNDPRNALFMEYVKYLDYFKPKAFIMENVIGLLSKKTANGTRKFKNASRRK